MNVNPRLWLWTFVALVFVTGALAGVLVDRSFGVRAPFAARGEVGRGGGPAVGLGQSAGPGIDRLIDLLDWELDLDASQRDAIRAILEDRRERLRRLQDEARQRFVDEQQALLDEMAAVLTTGQASALRALVRERPGLVDGGPAGRGGRGGGRPGGSGRGGRE